MSTHLHHFFIYIYFQELSVYESTYVNNAYTPKFRCLKTIVNVSTSHFHKYIFSHTICQHINVCLRWTYPKISMFQNTNNCQRIYVTFSYIYIFTYYLSTYQRMSTMNIPQNFYVLKRVSKYLRHIFLYIINIYPSTYQHMSTTHKPRNFDV